MTGAVAAVDLGATSGRVILGRVSEDRVDLTTVHRFANTPVATVDGLHWNILELYRHVLEGIGRALDAEPALCSVAVDSWAVDYALMRGDAMLGTPYHYRDDRTAEAVRTVHDRIGPAELYARNGLQFLPFNTVYQLIADGDLVRSADAMLMIPELFTYWLTGHQVAEVTNGSTTGLLNVRTRAWDTTLIELLGLPRGLFNELVEPGTAVGGLLGPVLGEVGAGERVTVRTVGSHDTASAVVGTPLTGDGAAYVSCGTWGLVGVELDRPVLSEAGLAAGFTNEAGVDGRIRFLHNVMGLWLLSESVRTWERESGPVDLPELIAEAGRVRGRVAVFDVDDTRFLAPGDMPRRIMAYCTEHDLVVPRTRVELVRSILESLAEAFAGAVVAAGELSGTRAGAVHLVGGGSQNTLLCQLTADRSGLPVLAGPVEATALGNVLVQARAEGLVTGDLGRLRALVAAALPPTRYLPREARR
ncbi:MAG: rhamnulokinase [Nocardioidaceae bacterium]